VTKEILLVEDSLEQVLDYVEKNRPEWSDIVKEQICLLGPNGAETIKVYSENESPKVVIVNPMGAGPIISVVFVLEIITLVFLGIKFIPY